MIAILLGIAAIFLFICFFWVLMRKSYELPEPPLIIKIIGWPQVIIFIVAVLLSVSYCVGSFMSEIIKELIR